MDELLWSFAVLWREPPAGSSHDVKTFLSNHGIHDHVQEFIDEIDAH